MSHSPSYLGVFLTFARNSLVRDMTFRANFIIDMISSISWMIMNLGFYALVYRETKYIADWDVNVARSKTATDMRANVLKQYSGLGMEFTLNDRVATYFPAQPAANK